jgi:hypothetical protein
MPRKNTKRRRNSRVNPTHNELINIWDNLVHMASVNAVEEMAIESMEQEQNGILETVQESETESETESPISRTIARRNRRRHSIRRITRRTFSQNPNRILDVLSNRNPSAIVIDGLDHALIGISEYFTAVYEKNLVIDIFINKDGASYEAALRHYHNLVNSFAIFSTFFSNGSLSEGQLINRATTTPIFVDLGWSGSDESIAECVETNETANVKKSKKKKTQLEGKDPTQTKETSNGPIDSLEL